MLEKIEVRALSKHIKFRVESCKSLSHLNYIRFIFIFTVLRVVSCKSMPPLKLRNGFQSDLYHVRCVQ